MRGIRLLVLVLVVLVGLLLVVDRVSAWAAGQIVADRVADELASHQVDSAPPEASIGGFPFLTQVAAGRYESVTLLLRDVGTGGVWLPAVELTATGVHASATTLMEGSGTIHADRVVGTAVIGYSSVAALTELDGLDLSATPGGALRVYLPAELMGVPLVLVGTADVDVSGNAVQVRMTGLTVEEPHELPPGAGPLVDQLAQAVSVEVALPPLPYGLAVESVRAEPAGLAVTLSARDVPIAR